MTSDEQSRERTDGSARQNRTEQMVLIGNDGGFGLPDAREYERDDGTTGIIPPDEVFMPPLRTTGNGWKKWHAIEGCGSTVTYVESRHPHRTTDRYDWELYCYGCGHGARWQDVLYISEEWYYDRMHAKKNHDWRLFDSLNLQPERAIELGADPTEAKLISVIDEYWADLQMAREESRKALRESGVLPQKGGADDE